MMDAIWGQKRELELLLTRQYVPRENLSEGQRLLASDLIKVVTGPRRAGKSVYCLLMLAGKKFGYLDFDDEKLVKTRDYDQLWKGMEAVYPGFGWVFLDEVQNLPDWELLVNKWQRRGANLVISGSNANLLGQEMATALTGRYAQIEVLPFSFKEYRRVKPGFGLWDYLRDGGYPEVVVKGVDKEPYLRTLYEAVLFKDVVKRFGIKNPQGIYDLGVYLREQFSSQFSFGSLARAVGLGSTNTAVKYARYLQEAYLYFYVSRYDFGARQRLKSSKKGYLVDTGFAPAMFSENSGRMLENAVMLELVRRGYKPDRGLYYYQTKSGKQVDFVLKEGTRASSLMQVCLKMGDEKTRKRELGGLVEAARELGCRELVVITFDESKEEVYKGEKVKLVKAEEWWAPEG